MRQTHIPAFIVIFMVAVAGCDLAFQHQQSEAEVTTSTKAAELEQQSLTWFNNKPYSELPLVQRAERLENELSEIIEEFAGLWYEPDQEEIIIALVKQNGDYWNESALNEAQALIRERLSFPGFDLSDVSFRTQEAAHTFRELQHIRDLLTPALHERDDIVETYIDPQNNVFTIGVLETADKAAYRQVVTSYSVSDEYVAIVETGPIEFASMPEDTEMMFRNNETLVDRVRPLAGGLQIARRLPDQPTHQSTCTYGFNIKLNGTDMWITNSHCTDQMGSPSTTDFYQPSVSWSNFIGTEFRDYQGSNNWRLSDSAIIDHSGGQARDFGAIYATEHPFASIDLIPDQGGYVKYEIIEEFDFTISGMPVHKIGKTTGWSTGTINHGCATITISGWTFVCQLRSNLPTSGGDSGSPVFFADNVVPTQGEPAALLGLHFARRTRPLLPDRAYHSWIDGIRDDLLLSGETMTTH